MKNVLLVGILLILAIQTGLFIKVSCDLENYKIQVANEKWENEERLRGIEKDIRILKMDSYINTNGFEGGSND